jgi:hypothetical protein
VAAGPLSEPAVPRLRGIERFEGATFHSAAWDHHHELTGERVAVIGTGASAIQFVPQIQPRVGRLHLFQRTAPWVMPRRARPLSGFERAVYRRVPAAQHLMRAGPPARPPRHRRGRLPEHRDMSARAAGSLEVRPEAQEAWNAELQRDMRGTVWTAGGCASWYIDRTGANTTLWPGFTFRFRRLLRRFDAESYVHAPPVRNTEPATLARAA